MTHELRQDEIEQVRVDLVGELTEVAGDTKYCGRFSMFMADMMDNLDFANQVDCLLAAGIRADREAASDIMQALITKMNNQWFARRFDDYIAEQASAKDDE